MYFFVSARRAICFDSFAKTQNQRNKTLQNVFFAKLSQKNSGLHGFDRLRASKQTLF
jgi:hypothetical protein